MGDAPAKLLNAHHYGGVEKLPQGSVYIGRQGPYGNSYSMTSGALTREECVALHRVSLYQDLKTLPLLLSQLRQELGNRDLACWCVQPKKIVGCHGNNYLHILSQRCEERDYTKSILYYLTQDLRWVLQDLDIRINKQTINDNFLALYAALGDVRADVQCVLIGSKKTDPHQTAVALAIALIDLELGYHDSNDQMLLYRLSHAHWVADRFYYHQLTREGEPISPDLPLPRLQKRK